MLILFICFNQAYAAKFDQSEAKKYYQEKLKQKGDFTYKKTYLRDILKDLAKKYGLKTILNDSAFIPADKKDLLNRLHKPEYFSFDFKNITLNEFLKTFTQKADLMYVIIISKDDAVLCFYSYNNPFID